MAVSQPNDSGPSGFRVRLMCEALRRFEEARAQLLDDPPVAGNKPLSLVYPEHPFVPSRSTETEALLIGRYARLPEALSALRTVQLFDRGLLIAILVIAGLSAMAGVGAVRAVLPAGAGATINMYWLLGSLLGLNAIALLFWVFTAVLSSARGPRISLGNFAVEAVRFFGRKRLKQPLSQAAAATVIAENSRRPMIKPLIAVASHAGWSAFLVAALFALIISFSTRSYQFAWETTLLNESVFVDVTTALGKAPAMLGIDTPDREMIRGAKLNPQISRADSPQDAALWARFLLALIFIYGLVPRLVLFGISLAVFLSRRRRYRLQTDRATYARVLDKICPPATVALVTDADEPEDVSDANAPFPARQRLPFDSELSILAYEMVTPPEPWPPRVEGIEWRDLGAVDGQADFERVAKALKARLPDSGVLVVVAPLPLVPDRGVRARLRDLRECAQGIVLLLTQGQKARNRLGSEDFAIRLSDWQKLAADPMIAAERVIEWDLNYQTDHAARQFLEDLRTEGSESETSAPSPLSDQPESTTRPKGTNRNEREHFQERAVAESLAAFQSGVLGWSPSLSEAEVRTTIAEVGRPFLSGDEPSFSGAFSKLSSLISRQDRSLDVTAVKDAVTGLHTLMPPSFQTGGKWAAAGGIAGLAACMGAGVVFPPAIAAMPLWGAVGAGGGLLAQLALPGSPSSEPKMKTEANDDSGSVETPYSDLVAAIGMEIALLSFQGLGEAEISRRLDRLFDPLFEIETREDFPRWFQIYRTNLWQSLMASDDGDARPADVQGENPDQQRQGEI
ncbi:MAG: DUF2868 domain-containing protein [Pseudomonadota bacterium]